MMRDMHFPLIYKLPQHFERAGDILREMPGVYGADNGGSHRGVCEDQLQALLRRVITLKAKVAAGKRFF